MSRPLSMPLSESPSAGSAESDGADAPPLPRSSIDDASGADAGAASVAAAAESSVDDGAESSDEDGACDASAGPRFFDARFSGGEAVAVAPPLFGVRCTPAKLAMSCGERDSKSTSCRKRSSRKHLRGAGGNGAIGGGRCTGRCGVVSMQTLANRGGRWEDARAVGENALSRRDRAGSTTRT